MFDMDVEPADSVARKDQFVVRGGVAFTDSRRGQYPQCQGDDSERAGDRCVHHGNRIEIPPPTPVVGLLESAWRIARPMLKYTASRSLTS